jgi:hypothetical protein
LKSKNKIKERGRMANPLRASELNDIPCTSNHLSDLSIAILGINCN